MSKVSLLYLIVLNSIIFVNGETCSGTVEPSANLVEEEKCSEYVKEAADFATLEIHKQKLRNGEYDQCTTLENKVINGKKQVGEGLRYCLQIRINPKTVQSEECDRKLDTKMNKWKPELCETEILWQAWKKPKMELLRSVCLQIED